MEIKKTKRASLEKSRSVFALFGLIIALSLVWSAFEFKTYDKMAIEFMGDNKLDFEEDFAVSTKPLKPPPPPMQTTAFKVVDVDTEVPDLFEFDVETDEDDIIALQVVDEEEEEPVFEAPIFVFVEDQPVFPGGEEARLRYLANSIKYPEFANKSGIQGTVYTTFVVEKNGEITNVEILRGIGGGCDLEAIEAIKAMPRWKPGKQRGRNVRVQFNMPVKFILE